jgi:SpoVK/Ycf46/Vps4 family AAA+-type ATPase
MKTNLETARRLQTKTAAEWRETRYRELIHDALRRIPVQSPEWTDYNQSDPGVALIQLFAWLSESLINRLNSMPESDRPKFRKVAARVRRRARRNRVLIIGGNERTRSAAARFIVSRHGLNLYRVDLATVVSKFLGETEKNLRRLFDLAEDSGAILFFDEADALSGKRSEVKDSHDRYANQDITWLLKRLDRHKGLVILATNRKEKLDTPRMCKLHCNVSRLARRPRRSAKARGKVTK